MSHSNFGKYLKMEKKCQNIFNFLLIKKSWKNLIFCKKNLEKFKFSVKEIMKKIENNLWIKWDFFNRF